MNRSGEAAIIERHLVPLSSAHPGALGLRDDAAWISPPDGHDIVVTMDAIAAGVHFLPSDPPQAIGWKALAVNVSDLVAKGAAPHAYLMSLAFPEAPEEAWLAALAAGLGEAQNAFGITLVGGDTDRRPGPVAITITALGLVPSGRMVRRGAAEPGDRVYVTGTLGDSAIGLALRTGSSRALAWRIDGAAREVLEQRYLRPVPPVAITAVLRDHARAAMDISDGLLKDLGRMCRTSGVTARIRADMVPLSREVAMVLADDARVIEDILAGGDDYQVLAAVAASNARAFEAAGRAAGVAVTEIGAFGAAAGPGYDIGTGGGGGVSVESSDGQPLAINRDGHDHF